MNILHQFSAKLLGLVLREWIGLAVCFIVFSVYLFLAPGYIVGGDNAEFVLLSQMDGIAHPPGYPLYTLYLRALSWLPLGPIKLASVATSFLGFLQILLLYFACRAWRVSQVVSAVCVAFYGVSGLALTLNTHAEVFAMNNLLVACFLLIGSRFLLLYPRTTFALNSLLVGLGLSNHHSFVLVSPLIVCIAFQSFRLVDQKNKNSLLIFASFCLLLGLLPYWFLFSWSAARRYNVISWGEISNLSSLIHHFLRRDYGTFKLSSGKDAVDLAGQQLLLVRSYFWSWTVILPFVFLGYFLSLKKLLIQRRPEFWLWLSLLFSSLLSGPLFVARFNIAPDLPGPALLERFHFLPVMLLLIPIATGLDLTILKARKVLSQSNVLVGREFGFHAALSALIAGFALYFSGSIGLQRYGDRISPLIHQSLVNALVGLPRGSMLFVTGDHKVFGYAYLQMAEGMRKDVQIISPSLLQYHWYRKRLGVLSASSGGAALELMRRGAAAKQPLFIDLYMSNSVLGLNHYQYGLFRRVVRSGDPIPVAEDLFAANKYLFDALPSLRGKHAIGDGWATLVENEKIGGWFALSKDLNKMGRKDLARQAVEHSLDY